MIPDPSGTGGAPSSSKPLRKFANFKKREARGGLDNMPMAAIWRAAVGDLGVEPDLIGQYLEA